MNPDGNRVRRILLPLLSLSVLLPFVVGGCVRKGPSRASAGASELVYPIGMEPDSLDPHATNSVASSELLQNVFEGLLTLNEQSQLAPCLAERWEVSSDGRTFTFHLDPRAAFSNGRKVTADDVKWSLERWCWPETKAPSVQPIMRYVVGGNEVMAGKRRDLTGVKAVDSRTVAITIDRPRVYMLLGVGTAIVVCREALEGVKGQVGVAQAIGTGPFVLKEYQPGRRVVLEANRGYFRGRPPLDRIVRPVVVNSGTSHMKYENGEVDACAVALADFARDRDTPELRDQCRAVQTGSTMYVGMDPRLISAFRDRRVRKAFGLAIDGQAISRVAYHTFCPVAAGLLPPGVVGNDPARKPAYDPDAARKLLAEAGFPGGKGFPSLTLVYLQSSPNYSAAAQIVRDNLKQNLGIEVDLQEREQGTLIADQNHDRLAFYLMRWTAVDPHDFLPTLLGTGSAENHFNYSNPKLDRICEEADTLTDMEKRAALYREAEDLAIADMPLIPLVHSGEYWLIKPYVKDVATNIGGWMPHYKTRVVR